jgi:hypothetical protein
MLLSASDCEDQCTHTDFPDRSRNGEPPENPSLFAFVMGMQGASLKVVPQSHKHVARIEYFIDKVQGDEGCDAAGAVSDLAKHITETIKPYSLFIERAIWFILEPGSLQQKKRRILGSTQCCAW